MDSYTPEAPIEKTGWKKQLTTVTPVSKYLALFLVITLPFVGGWIGYIYAPQKIVEVERLIVVKESAEGVRDAEVEKAGGTGEFETGVEYPSDVLNTSLWQEYSSDSMGISFKYPVTLDSVSDYPKTFFDHGAGIEFAAPPVWETHEWSRYDISIIEPVPLSDGPWSIRYLEMTEDAIEDLIARTGRQFADRREQREDIVIDGREGVLVTVTTDEYLDWISQTVLIENNGKTLRVRNGSVGREPYLKAFELFYNSIRF